MKQTAVEWLYNKILYIDNEYDMKLITKSEYQFKRRDIIEQAKEIFEQQIENAFNKGFSTTQWDKTKVNKAEQYYNETFKSK